MVDTMIMRQSKQPITQSGSHPMGLSKRRRYFPAVKLDLVAITETCRHREPHLLSASLHFILLLLAFISFSSFLLFFPVVSRSGRSF